MSQTQREAPPDIRQLAQQNLPQAPFPGGKQAPFRVYMDRGVHARIQQHSTEDVSVEICGVLVGKWARDADGPYVHVLECIPIRRVKRNEKPLPISASSHNRTCRKRHFPAASRRPSGFTWTGASMRGSSSTALRMFPSKSAACWSANGPATPTAPMCMCSSAF